MYNPDTSFFPGTMTEITLSNGVKMPSVLLGTYRTRGPVAVELSVKSAVESGYRGIDTAAVYRNHKDIAGTLAKTLPDLNLSRSDIFLTSKLSPQDHGTEKCRAGILKCLDELETDYLDLFLIHWPGVQKLQIDDPQNQLLRFGFSFVHKNHINQKDAVVCHYLVVYA